MSDASFAVPIVVLTLLWALIGAGVPWFVPHSPNRGLIQTMIVLTAICCYTFWLLCWMHQINPLIGPELDNVTVRYLNKSWGYIPGIPK